MWTTDQSQDAYWKTGIHNSILIIRKKVGKYINKWEGQALLTGEYQRPAGSVEGALQRKVTVQPSERLVQARAIGGCWIWRWGILLRSKIFACSKVPPHRCLIRYKGKNSNYIAEKLGNTLTKWSNLTSPMGTYGCCVPPDVTMS